MYPSLSPPVCIQVQVHAGEQSRLSKVGLGHIMRKDLMTSSCEVVTVEEMAMGLAMYIVPQRFKHALDRVCHMYYYLLLGMLADFYEDE